MSNKQPPALAHCATGLLVVTAKRTRALVYASEVRAHVSDHVRDAELHQIAVVVWQWTGVDGGWKSIYDSEETAGIFR